MPRSFVLAALVGALAACCPAPPPPAPPVERGPLPQPAELCAHLAELGCPEGSDPICASKIAQVEHDRLTILPERCWMAAATKAAARKCGQLACEATP